MPRRCEFCQREVPLTLEHAFPRWVGRVFPPAKSVTHIHRTEGEIVREYTTAEMDAKVRRVCARCNNTWMHELERVARLVLTPLIRPGQPRRLGPVEQEIIAVWTIKTALMCEFLDVATRSAPRSHFQALFQTLKPPAGSNVWVAALRTPAEKLDYNHRRLTFAFDNPGVPAKHGYLTAFVIGRLVLYVMGVDAEAPWIHTTSEQSQRGVIPIQPRRWAFPQWPPPEVFSSVEDTDSFLLAIAPERETEDTPSTEKG